MDDVQHASFQAVFMNSKEAIKYLESIGYVGRNGNGSHYVMKKGPHTIVISMGHNELSKGCVGKVKTAIRRSK